MIWWKKISKAPHTHVVEGPQNAAISAHVIPEIDALQKSLETKILDSRQETIEMFAKVAEIQLKSEEKNANFEEKMLRHIGNFADQVGKQLGEIRNKNSRCSTRFAEIC